MPAPAAGLLRRALPVALAAALLHRAGVTRWLADSERLPSDDFTSMAARDGYASEEHTVTTEDEYLLTIFRIERGEHCPGDARSTPVYLMHGLLQSSELWLAAGVAYLLADRCHDTWVGNVRGNHHGRRHRRLDPDRDAEFWEFSIDEMGYYDVPAAIDYILSETGAERLNYIGYSQGAACALIALSQRPEYCRKVGVVIAAGPSTALRYLSSSFAYAFEVSARLESALTGIGMYEVMPKSSPIQRLAERFCRFALVRDVLCRGFFDAIDSPNPGSVADSTYERIYDHFPAGTSIRTMARYGQVLRAGLFQKYDFGAEGNERRYGSARPPAYELRAVAAPVVLLQGRADTLVGPADARWLAAELPEVEELYFVEDPLWNHFDHVFSSKIEEMLFPKIQQYLLKYGTRQLDTKKIHSNRTIR